LPPARGVGGGGNGTCRGGLSVSLPRNKVLSKRKEKNVMSEIQKYETKDTTALDTVTKAIEMSISPLAKRAGEHWEHYHLSRDVITKANTKDVKLTARQYLKKNGELGKLTLTFMQNEGEHEEKRRLYHLIGNK